MAARCETPEVVEVVEKEKVEQITQITLKEWLKLREEGPSLRKVKEMTLNQLKTVLKMTMITTDVSMGNTTKKKAEVQLKVLKAMLENLKGGIYEAIVVCEIWYPFEGNENACEI